MLFTTWDSESFQLVSSCVYRSVDQLGNSNELGNFNGSKRLQQDLYLLRLLAAQPTEASRFAWGCHAKRTREWVAAGCRVGFEVGDRSNAGVGMWLVVAWGNIVSAGHWGLARLAHS